MSHLHNMKECHKLMALLQYRYSSKNEMQLKKTRHTTATWSSHMTLSIKLWSMQGEEGSRRLGGSLTLKHPKKMYVRAVLKFPNSQEPTNIYKGRGHANDPQSIPHESVHACNLKLSEILLCKCPCVSLMGYEPIRPLLYVVFGLCADGWL